MTEEELIRNAPVSVLVSTLSRSLFDKHDDVLDGNSSELEDWLSTLDFMMQSIDELREKIPSRKMTEEADALITEYYANILACKQDMEYMLNVD